VGSDLLEISRITQRFYFFEGRTEFRVIKFHTMLFLLRLACCMVVYPKASRLSQ
jgi:hypothetical protein